MKPKLEAMLERFPKIKGQYIDVDRSPRLGANYGIFTIPGLILFIEGKETIRYARHISLNELEGKVERYYSMIYE